MKNRTVLYDILDSQGFVDQNGNHSHLNALLDGAFRCEYKEIKQCHFRQKGKNFMITADKKIFERDEFAMQVIARGGFIDCGTDSGKIYYVDTINLRANHVMANGYADSIFFGGSDWQDSYTTKEEWEKDKQKCEEHRKIWESKVKDDLKTIIPNIYDGSCLIKKVHIEFFTVMHTFEMEGDEKS